MALLNTSVPGIISSSPTARPDIEIIKFLSKVRVPFTSIPDIIYFFGVLAVKISANAGFIDMGVLST